MLELKNTLNLNKVQAKSNSLQKIYKLKKKPRGQSNLLHYSLPAYPTGQPFQLIFLKGTSTITQRQKFLLGKCSPAM